MPVEFLGVGCMKDARRKYASHEGNVFHTKATKYTPRNTKGPNIFPAPDFVAVGCD
jgi:hypothetical protein